MKTPDPTKAESSAPSKRNFIGTNNLRQLRAVAEFLVNSTHQRVARLAKELL